MARWHFCNFTQFLCLSSQNTRSQKLFYASVDKKSVPKTSICLGCGESKPKTHIFGLGWQRTGAKMRTPFFFFFFPALSISLYNSISLFSLPATYTSTVAATTPLWPPSRYRCWFAAPPFPPPPFPVSLIKFYLLLLGFVEKGLKCRVEEGMKPGGLNVGRSGHTGDVGPKSRSRSSANQIWNEDDVGQPRISSSCHPATVLPSPSRESPAPLLRTRGTSSSVDAKNWATSLPTLSATRKRGKNARRMLQRLLVSKKCLENAGTVREQKMFGECGDCQRAKGFRGHSGCGRKKLLRGHHPMGWICGCAS